MNIDITYLEDKAINIAGKIAMCAVAPVAMQGIFGGSGVRAHTASELSHHIEYATGSNLGPKMLSFIDCSAAALAPDFMELMNWLYVNSPGYEPAPVVVSENEHYELAPETLDGLDHTA